MANGANQRITNKMIFDEIGGINKEIKEKVIPVFTIIKPLQKQVSKNTVFRLKTIGALKIIVVLLTVLGVLLKVFKII